ncbi:hypothetical protein C0J52_22919 [Blattella germanica]|nr:hypothetical protein C0J52_22919 [Blattella germanica]
MNTSFSIELFFSTIASESPQPIPQNIKSTTQPDSSKSSEELAHRNRLASIIWNITNKYGIFNSDISSNDSCLDELNSDHRLIAPYMVNVTLNETIIFLDDYSQYEFQYSSGNELAHALDLYENHSKIMKDQDVYFSAVLKVSEHMLERHNKTYVCHGNSTCGCIYKEILQNYGLQLSTFRVNQYALWEYILFGAYIDPFFSALIILIGLILNGTLIFAFAREKSVRREANVMIFSLILNNIIMLVVYIPIYYVHKTHRSQLFDKLAFYFVQIMVISVSSSTVLMLTVQRYFDVSRILTPTVRSFRLTGTMRSAFYFLLVWTWSISMAGLMGLHEDAAVLDFVLYFLVYLFIYSVVKALFSALTSRKLQHAAENDQITGELHYVISSSVVVTLTLAYYIVHIPFFFFLPFDRSETERSVQYFFPTIVRVICFVFQQFFFSYPIINAIVLYQASSLFRRQFRKYLFRCWYDDEDGQYLTMSSLQNNEAQE